MVEGGVSFGLFASLSNPSCGPVPQKSFLLPLRNRGLPLLANNSPNAHNEDEHWT